MRSILKNHSISRWLVSLTPTLILLALLGHKSLVPQLFSRYSYKFSMLLLAMGMWALTSWWISLDSVRYRRLLNHIRQFPICSFAILIIGMLTLLDFFPGIPDVICLAPVIPLILTIVMWLLSRSDPRDLTNKLALLIVSIAIGLYISEGFFRIVLLEHKVPITEREFVRQIASSWPRHIPVEKGPGTYRILGLSDSFGQAGGLENYHYLLEALLQDDGLDVEIVNISVGEYELPDQLDVLRRFGARYRPDLVLHGFFVGNDFAVPKKTLMSYRGISIRTAKSFVSYRPRNFLLRQWLKRYRKVLQDRNLRKAEADRNESAGTFSMERFLEIEWQRLNICRIKPNANAKWQETIKLLDEIRGEVNQMGAKYVMLIHPDQFQVENKLRHQIKEKHHLDLDSYDFDIPQRFLNNYCTTRGVSCLDLLPIFRSNGSEGGLYLLRDTHYNQDGNALAAKMIFNFLHERHLLVSRKHETYVK